MRVTLDGQDIFDAQVLDIEVGTLRRDLIERSVAGLDGAVSIDLGGRGREIKQRGVLRAGSRVELDKRIGVVSGFMDGRVHTLVSERGEEFSNLRMDSFEVSDARVDGGGLLVDYEIRYRQLRV